MNKLHALGASTLAAVAIAAPLTMAAPAQATVSQDGCRFTALAPKHVYNKAGHKVIRFTVKAKCNPGRSVSFRSQAWERDNGSPGDVGPSDKLGSWLGVWKNWHPGETRYWHHYVPMPANESDKYEELFHRVRFRVSAKGVTGKLSGWDTSKVVKVPHFGVIQVPPVITK